MQCKKKTLFVLFWKLALYSVRILKIRYFFLIPYCLIFRINLRTVPLNFIPIKIIIDNHSVIMAPIFVSRGDSQYEIVPAPGSCAEGAKCNLKLEQTGRSVWLNDGRFILAGFCHVTWKCALFYSWTVKSCQAPFPLSCRSYRGGNGIVQLLGHTN